MAGRWTVEVALLVENCLPKVLRSYHDIMFERRFAICVNKEVNMPKGVCRNSLGWNSNAAYLVCCKKYFLALTTAVCTDNDESTTYKSG